MNHKRIISYLIVFSLIFPIILTGCGQESSTSIGNEEGNNEKLDLLPKKVEADKADKVLVEEKEKDSWTDEKGLIRIWKENDNYYMYSDLEKWEEIHDIYNYHESIYNFDTQLVDRELVIEGLDGEVKDVAIVSIDGYGGGLDEKNDFPLIFMLMENGEVAWIYGYPPWDSNYDEGESFYQDSQHIYGYLPYLRDIVSLSYEKDTEGLGDPTLFAIDGDGLRYDIRYAFDFAALSYIGWATFPANAHDGEFESIQIDLGIDGDARMIKTIYGEVEIFYEGNYDIHLDDSSSRGYRAPSISLDLKLDYITNDAYTAEEKFKGTFMLDLDEANDIIFYPSDGDSFDDRGEFYKFMIVEPNYDFSIWALTDGEFMEYFLDVMPHVKIDMVENQGMSLLVDGESTELIDYGYCRDIVLGTNKGESFVREKHFTVTEEGSVFEYNPLEDLWYLEFHPNES